MELLELYLVVDDGTLDFLLDLVAEVQFHHQVALVDVVNVIELMYLLVLAEDLQKLDLPHPLLVDFHFAAEEVHFFLLECLLGELDNAHEISEEAKVFTVELVCEGLLVFLEELEQFGVDLLLYVLEHQEVLFELDLDEVQRLM